MTPRKRRLRLPWLPVGLAAAALAAGGWYWWTGTIHYSLLRLNAAIRDRNRYLFEQHVDLDPIIRRTTEEFLAIGMQELMEQPMTELQAALVPAGLSYMQLLKPQFQEQLRDAVVRGIESGGLQRGDLSATRQPTGNQLDDVLAKAGDEFPKLKPLKLGLVRRRGSSATVVLEVQFDDGLPGHPEHLKVRFVRTPQRYWRATELENFKEILERWDQREQKRLHAANQPVRRMLNDMVSVSEASTEQGLDATGTEKDIWVVATVKNNASAGLRGLEADITIRDTGGALRQVRIADPATIPPGETKRIIWPIGADLMDPADLLIYNSDPKTLSVEVELRRLVFSDGRDIRVADSLEEVGETLKKRPAAPPPVPAPIEAL
jgi:hypothetical protein